MSCRAAPGKSGDCPRDPSGASVLRDVHCPSSRSGHPRRGGKDEKSEPILAKISQETLADMIGTTRSRVSFFMNKFRKLGLIDYNGGIEVHSTLLNVVLHEEPHIRI